MSNASMCSGPTARATAAPISALTAQPSGRQMLETARLAEVVDADNADALEAEAEAAFAPRLSAACRRAKRAAS